MRNIKRLREAGIVAMLVLLAFGFQNRPLIGGDEARYTCVALELVRTGDLLHLQLSEGVPHFTKPPLFQASMAAAITLLGRHEWVARLPNGLAYLFTGLLLWAIARVLRIRQAWLVPCIYASFVVPFAAASVITTDTLLVFWETAAVSAYMAARFSLPDGSRPSRLIILMWVCMGAAFLTKGPPSLLPLAAILLFESLSKRWRGVREILLTPGLLLFAGLGFLWYVLAARANPGLLQFWLHHEVESRVLGSRALHGDSFLSVFTVYLPVLLAGTLPWTWVYFGKIKHLLVSMKNGSLRSVLQANPYGSFLLLWLMLPTLILIVLPNRQPLYLLPAFAPLALLAAQALDERMLKKGRLVLLVGLWCAVLLAGRALSDRLLKKPDWRDIAASFRQVAPDARKVCFVEFNAPWFGLLWYLNTPVDAAGFQDAPSTMYEKKKPLSRVLTNNLERVCFVVKANDLDRFEQAVIQSGATATSLGSCFGSEVMEVQP